MYGDAASDLMRHLKRDHAQIIPEYQHQLVERIARENEELYADNLRCSQSASGDSQQENGQVQDENERTQGENVQTHVDENSEDKPPQDDVEIGFTEITVMRCRHVAKLWNKRCIIFYHQERLRRLKRLRWEHGNNLPREIINNLSREELEWFTTYNDNLFNYMSSLNDGNGLDLTLYKMPPKKLYVQVKCIREYGQFDLGDGQPVVLKKDSIHNLPLNQCEKLIQQGVLEQINL